MIFYGDKLVGLVSCYWEDGSLKEWLEFGIIIYRKDAWGKAIGRQASKLWIDYLFDLYPHIIRRLGFTTWSGNMGMLKIGQKLHMLEEARIRQVRYYQGSYYDSIKYGILREEWKEKRALD